MTARASSRLLPLLLLFTALAAFLIQSGELGTADTLHRLQVTHSLWTGQPQVFPYEYPEFGLHGRGGRIYAWFGIGQSLLMLPADLLATAAVHLPIWRDYVQSQADPTIRSILVSISMNIVVSVLTALVVFRLLLQFGFAQRHAAVGVLMLLFATTHLHYAQNMQENNYILLLTLTGLLLQLRWLQTGSRRALAWGAVALGYDLLTRITTALDLLMVTGFLLLACWWRRETVPAAEWRRKWIAYARVVVPIYAAFFFLDRLYQFIRFGSWTNTYVTYFAKEERQIDPSLPLKYPFSGHFFAGGLSSGMLGPLFAPEKSIFLFDLLLPLTLVTVVVLWKRLEPLVRSFLIASGLLIVAYMLFYARYFAWAGDFAWGDRYISSAVQLTTLLTWPLLLHYRQTISTPLWRAAIGVTLLSVAIQAASLAFWLPLEIYQEETFGHPTWVIALRLKNIAAHASGNMQAWGLNTEAMFQDPWDAQHITCWNFLPSLLRHVGVAPLSTVYLLYAAWGLVSVALIVVGGRLMRILGEREGRPAASSPSSTV